MAMPARVTSPLWENYQLLEKIGDHWRRYQHVFGFSPTEPSNAIEEDFERAKQKEFTSSERERALIYQNNLPDDAQWYQTVMIQGDRPSELKELFAALHYPTHAQYAFDLRGMLYCIGHSVCANHPRAHLLELHDLVSECTLQIYFIIFRNAVTWLRKANDKIPRPDSWRPFSSQTLINELGRAANYLADLPKRHGNKRGRAADELANMPTRGGKFMVNLADEAANALQAPIDEQSRREVCEEVRERARAVLGKHTDEIFDRLNEVDGISNVERMLRIIQKICQIDRKTAKKLLQALIVALRDPGE